MATNTYDALIVGAGITGGWAAIELTEKGLQVLVLEAGRTIVSERDYVEHVPVWELKFRGWDNRAERQPDGGMHGFLVLRKSFADVHGDYRSRVRLRSFTNEKERVVERAHGSSGAFPKNV